MIGTVQWNAQGNRSWNQSLPDEVFDCIDCNVAYLCGVVELWVVHAKGFPLLVANYEEHGAASYVQEAGHSE